MRTVLAIVKRVLARHLLQLSVPALILAGCSQPPETSPNPPTDFVKVLVHGPVESVFLEPLKDSLELTVHDSSQKLEDFDLLILDGDHHTPAALKDDTLVQEALSTGKWVLFLDATTEHKRDGLGQVLLSATDGTSLAYAAHVGQDARGRLAVQVVEYPSPSEVKYERGGDPMNGGPGASQPVPLPSPPSAPFVTSLEASQRIDPSSTSAFTDTLLERLLASAQTKIQALPSDIPADLIYATFYFSQVKSWQVGDGGRHPKPKAG